MEQRYGADIKDRDKEIERKDKEINDAKLEMQR
jgi:hypothetical protein